MIIRHEVFRDNGVVQSHYDDTDKRINKPCQKCGWAKKYVKSFVMKDVAGVGVRREQHQLRCDRCNDYICALPFKFTKEQASNFVMPFGKHKGKPLQEVPKDYLDWLICQPGNESLAKKVGIMRGDNA